MEENAREEQSEIRPVVQGKFRGGKREKDGSEGWCMVSPI